MPDRQPPKRAYPDISRRRASCQIAGAFGAAVMAKAPVAAASQPPPAFYSSGGQYIQLRPERLAPVAPLRTAGGSIIDFGRYRGKVVLLNFWATWCVPCVHEMPSLDRLAASVDDDKLLQIVPIAIDDGGQETVRAFYRRFGLSHLGIYADPDQQIGYFDARNVNHGVFPLYALPITYAIDPFGRIDGYIPGAARWNSPRAAALIEYLAGRAAP